MARKRRTFDVSGSLDGGDAQGEKFDLIVPVFRDHVEILPPEESAPPALPQKPRDVIDPRKLSPEAAAFVGASKSPETLRVYGYHWRVFHRWMVARGKRALPSDPHDVASYVADRALKGVTPAEDEIAGHEPWGTSTINQALAAIGLMHEMRGFDSPRSKRVVKAAWSGIRRTKGARPERKEALKVDVLVSIARAYDVTNLRDLRNKSILLLGWSAALRRGELAALEVGDLRREARGFRVDLQRHFSGGHVLPGTKTNPSGEDEETIAISMGENHATCPVLSTEAWLEAAKIESGPLYRAVSSRGKVSSEGITPQTVATTLKDACERLGLDPRGFSGHSLRAGLATSAAMAGRAPWSIQKKTRHKSLDMLMRYIRDAEIFGDDAGKGLGL